MNKEKIIHTIKTQLELTNTMLSILGVTTNIQVYLLTDHEGKRALTKNPLLRSQGDDSLPSSPKKYDYLDAISPLQVVLAVNEKKTNYKHIENEERNPKQGFVVASPIALEQYGTIGCICFAGGTDPILEAKISYSNFKLISEALTKSLASSFQLFSEKDLIELSK